MNDHDTPEDDEFDNELREKLSDPVPPGLLQRSLDLATWLTIDRELAELVVADAAAASVRAAGDGASFTFESAHWVIEVEFALETRDVTGQLLPPTTAKVTLHTMRGAQSTTDTDTHGVFRIRNVPAERVCLTIESMSDTKMAVRTEFFQV